MVSQHGSKMPQTHTSHQAEPRASIRPQATRVDPYGRSWSSLLVLPRPIKQLFDAFPLRSFAANSLPENLQRSAAGKGHSLFVWTTSEDALAGNASFNPACFRWQLYLKSRNIECHTVSSNNHASTIDRLPFLLVSDKTNDQFSGKDILSSRDLSKWAADQVETWPKELDIHYDAYMSLLNNEIRLAWQHHMYLTDNFYAFVLPSYIASQSHSKMIQVASSYELRKAARQDFLKTAVKLDNEDVYAKAEMALEALNNVLARKMRIQGGGFADREPSLLEATLYAYLYLLLEMPVMRWKNARLPTIVRKYPELLRMHRDVSTVYNFSPPAIYRNND